MNLVRSIEPNKLVDSTSPTDGCGSSTETNINSLPLEVLIEIFSNLDPVQLSLLRLVCKYWNFAVLDKTAWINSFRQRFGTNDIFPSLTNSSSWVTEYFDRLKVYKKWNKSASIHRSYQLINNEFRYIDFSLVNFNQGRILIFSNLNGNISTCSLNNGKNQAFIPGNDIFTRISSYSMNWNYLLIGKSTGELYLKNLATSTSSTSTRLSLTKLIDENESNDDSIISTEINPDAGKSREKIDCISGSWNGRLRFWELNGKMINELQFNEPILNIKSDFRKILVVQTNENLYIINFVTFETRKFPLDFRVEEFKQALMDVDYGDSNIIISYNSFIRVINFKDVNKASWRELNLPDSVKTIRSKLQTVKYNNLHKRDPNLVGSDGLLYANILSDDTVLVWNIRDSNKYIIPQCKIKPEFNCRSPSPPSDFPLITSVALNSSIIAIGGYNGFTNLHNVFTGKFIKECSAKFPKKLSHMYNEIIPINDIHLNEDQKVTNGVIICGDTIQYFQFGELEDDSKSQSTTPKKKLNLGYSDKRGNYKKIRDGMDDYVNLQELERRQSLLFDKYNGSLDDDDDELSIALAISESYNHHQPLPPHEIEDEDLRLAIELSKNSHQPSLTNGEDDEKLQEILKLSLVDQ